MAVGNFMVITMTDSQIQSDKASAGGALQHEWNPFAQPTLMFLFIRKDGLLKRGVTSNPPVSGKRGGGVAPRKIHVAFTYGQPEPPKPLCHEVNQRLSRLLGWPHAIDLNSGVRSADS
jgi:hypothetical protein